MMICSSKDIPGDLQGAVLAIGNFDGVHRGHRALLDLAGSLAVQSRKKLAILTFEPHPRKLFQPDGAPFRITPPAIKARLLEQAGVDTLFSLPFDWDFASQSAEQFIDAVMKQIAPAHIVVGEDFRYGQLRKGTPQMLRDAGFAVTLFEKIADTESEIISSSRIRTALRHGDINAANTLLGWDWYIEGPIVKGDQRGRTIGYPTANVPLGDTVHPAYGIYATLVQIDGESEWRFAATNIGIRPMFELKVGQVEAHIFDFDRDIYGKTLRVRPVRKLRGEAKFESLDALVAQIADDCAQARVILSAMAS